MTNKQVNRHPSDGQPFYCVVCGAGWNEFGACEEVDCRLESEIEASARAAQAIHIDARKAAPKGDGQ